MKNKIALLITKFSAMAKLWKSDTWIIVFKEEEEVKIAHSKLDISTIQQTVGYLHVITDLRIFENQKMQ